MSWTRPLSLALAVFALAPGLCPAQVTSWAPLSLPILFGQETPPIPPFNPYVSTPPESGPPQNPFWGAVRSVREYQPEEQDWNGPQPTSAGQYADLFEFFSSSFGDLSNRGNQGTNPFPLIEKLDQLAGPRNEIIFSMGCRGSEWWLPLCPASVRPYVTLGRFAMVFLGAWNGAPETCPMVESKVPQAVNQKLPVEEGNVGTDWCPFFLPWSLNSDQGLSGSIQNQQTRTGRRGPLEVEIFWGSMGAENGQPRSVTNRSCGLSQASCRDLPGVACGVACAAKCGAAGVETCSEKPCADAAKCPCSTKADANCCCGAKCGCAKKAVAEKKCGCGKDCSCCACKKTVLKRLRIRAPRDHIDETVRNREDLCPAFHPIYIMPPPPPPTAFLPHPAFLPYPPHITVALPPPPPLPIMMPRSPDFGVCMPPMPSMPYILTGRPGMPMAAPGMVMPASRVTPMPAVNLRTPLFDAQCDSVSSSGNADELVLSGNVRLTTKRGTPCALSAERVVINTRRGTFHAEGPGAMTTPVMGPAVYEVLPSTGTTHSETAPVRPVTVMPPASTSPARPR